MLGEKITATIKAKYYFGSPVTKAKVKYKVNRTSYNERWYPVGPWDWFYGPGYWWFAYDYAWYPGWQHWGCLRPMPFWWPHANQPPELVADQEVDIGARRHGEGRDRHGRGQGDPSRPGPQLHDHRRGGRRSRGGRSSARARCWSPASRSRSTPGSIAATIAWATRSRPTSRPARSTASRSRARASCTLLQDQLHEDGKPVETPVQTWQLDTNAEGVAQQQIDGLAGRAVSALVQADRRQGRSTTHRRRLRLHRSSAKASTARSSASTTWN